MIATAQQLKTEPMDTGRTHTGRTDAVSTHADDGVDWLDPNRSEPNRSDAARQARLDQHAQVVERVRSHTPVNDYAQVRPPVEATHKSDGARNKKGIEQAMADELKNARARVVLPMKLAGNMALLDPQSETNLRQLLQEAYTFSRTPEDFEAVCAAAEIGCRRTHFSEAALISVRVFISGPEIEGGVRVIDTFAFDARRVVPMNELGNEGEDEGGVE